MSAPIPSTSPENLLRVCLTRGANPPTASYVKIMRIQIGQDVPANRRPFSLLDDFLLIQFWTRQVFNHSETPIATPAVEQEAADLLNAFNSDPSVPPFTSLQIRIRLHNLLRSHSCVLRNAISANPKPLTFHQLSNFHTFFPFFGFGKITRESQQKRLGVKTWEPGSNQLTLLFPRRPTPLKNEARLTLQTSSLCSTSDVSRQFKILDDILILQHWYSSTLRKYPVSSSALADSTLQSLHTLHILTQRNPIPKFAAQDVHLRLQYLLQNYVDILHCADGAPPGRAVPLRHNFFSQFAAVYRFLRGRDIEFYDPSRRSRPVEFGLRIGRAESVERWKDDGMVGNEEDGDTRAESSEESKLSGGKRELWPGDSSEMESWEMGRAGSGEEDAEVNSITFYESRGTNGAERDRGGEGASGDMGHGDWDRKVAGSEARQQVVIPDEERHVGQGSDNKHSGGTSVVERTEELDLVGMGNCGDRGGVGGEGGAAKRRRDLEEQVKFEELMVKRLELEVKVRELAVRRERLELERAELRLKRRKVEVEMRDWIVPVGRLNDCVDMIEAGNRDRGVARGARS
eukprot:GFKZ01010545.1.p1 GENE.GFKZ01010545.1~~GFKZ01010545.1.p1  ORF type:complete len:573 (+),score=87.28 GFKZ01010545.1:246-1964(+)